MSLTALSTHAFTPPPSPGALQTVTASGWPRGFSVWLWGGSPGESRPCPSVESTQEGRGRGWGWGGGSAMRVKGSILLPVYVGLFFLPPDGTFVPPREGPIGPISVSGRCSREQHFKRSCRERSLKICQFLAFLSFLLCIVRGEQSGGVVC